MSSEWLDLRDDATASAEQQQQQQRQPCDARGVMRPLCMCVNQRHTRVGVGHECGYVVYRVVHGRARETHEDVTDAQQQQQTQQSLHGNAAESLAARRHAKRSLQQLVVDMRYNMRSRHSAAATAASSTMTTTSSSLSLSSTPSPSPRNVDDDVANNNNSNGGVAVMALLYEQPCMAVCGGGPTPLTPCNVVLLLCAGDVAQSLTLPHPVVHLALDARVLFVCTTHELRVYTNPVERQWTACRYVVSFVGGATAATTSATSSCSGVVTRQATPLPVLPWVVDYAHNSVLVRSAASACGFMLLRYDTHADTDAATTTADARSGLGQATRCRVRVVASHARAHRNALASLAMHTRATPSSSWSAGEDDVACSSSSGGSAAASMIVAACSVCATRITLWQLVQPPRPPTTATTTCDGAAAASFVLLREFRLGFRVPSAPFTPRGAAATATMTSTGATRARHNVAVDDATSARDEHTRVYHMQLIDDGALLLCTRGDRLHVFATGTRNAATATTTAAAHAGSNNSNSNDNNSDAAQQQQQQQAMTHNRPSMLAAVGRVLPASLASVQAYTRQDWAACDVALPLHDTVLLPRWLHVCTHEGGAVPAEAATATEKSVRTRVSSFGSYGYSNNSATTTALAMVRDTVGLMRSMHRLVRSATRSSSSSSHAAIAAAAAAGDASCTLPAVWGSAHTHLAPCLLLWEYVEHMKTNNNDDDTTVVAATTASTMTMTMTMAAARCKVLLDCVTCEGSYATWRLYKDTATLHAAPAVPLAAAPRDTLYRHAL